MFLAARFAIYLRLLVQGSDNLDITSNQALWLWQLGFSHLRMCLPSACSVVHTPCATLGSAPGLWGRRLPESSLPFVISMRFTTVVD